MIVTTSEGSGGYDMRRFGAGTSKTARSLIRTRLSGPWPQPILGTSGATRPRDDRSERSGALRSLPCVGRRSLVAAVALLAVLTLPSPEPGAGQALADQEGRQRLGLACTITGTSGDDALFGTSGRDVICGLGGDDEIHARDGADVVFGGAGPDELFPGDGADRAFGGPRHDDIFAGDGADVVHGGGAGDLVRGFRDKDRLFGDGGDDQIDAFAGSDVAFGGTGSDWIDGKAGRDVVRGGDGSDNCLWTNDGRGGDLIVGGPGTDTFETDPGDDKRSVERRMNCNRS
jgi:hypothetical protein